ncbi:hypothetical protein GQ607_016867 [Colletotrichum asianum]|uniref:Uncharacterized protein n=1 Tax=Colletotrichum asianum TaxID=702518 RepID=A0A8H3VVU2_9PEZI|nr:hypothetical protein GQ607_016867 [Colletotrichum asianum]
MKITKGRIEAYYRL